MSLTEALMKIISHAVGALTGVLVLATALEWLMPGSALPFFDAINPLLVLSIVTMLLFLRYKRKPGWLNTAQVTIGIAVAAVLLAILSLRVPNYAPVTLALLGAGVVGTFVWAMTYLTTSE